MKVKAQCNECGEWMEIEAEIGAEAICENCGRKMRVQEVTPAGNVFLETVEEEEGEL